MNTLTVYQTEAHNYSLLDTATEFARKLDGREVGPLSVEQGGKVLLFQLKEGRRTYSVEQIGGLNIVMVISEGTAVLPRSEALRYIHTLSAPGEKDYAERLHRWLLDGRQMVEPDRRYCALFRAQTIRRTLFRYYAQEQPA